MIDRCLLALHQWVVDATQKQPSWWALQSAHLSALSTVYRVFQFDFDVIIAVGSVVAQVFLYRIPIVYRSGNGLPTYVRYVVLVMVGIAAFVTSSPAMYGFWASYIMIVYFMCCRPPKPPVRKHKLAPQT